MKRAIYLSVSFILMCIISNANHKPTIGFIENKGQIHDQNNQPNEKVRYLLNLPNMNIQLKQNGFSYDTYVIEQIGAETNHEMTLSKIKHPIVKRNYHFHRVDVELINANSQPEIIAELPSEAYYNYYTTGTTEKDATNIHLSLIHI